MKIALCLYGVIGNKTSKSAADDSLDILYLGQQKYQQFLFDHYDVDVYLHTWSCDYEKEVVELYNPKGFIVEKQEYFDIPAYVKGDHEVQPNRRQNHYSRWRSTQKCLQLKMQSNIDYDFTMLSRYDVGLEKKINFESLSPDGLMCSKWYGVNYDQADDIFQDGRGLYYQIIERLGTSKGLVKYGRGFPHDSEGILDLWFIGGGTKLDIFSSLYDNLNEYMKPGNCPQAPFISNHKLALYHIQQYGLFGDVEFISDPVDDYCLLRYKYFNAKL